MACAALTLTACESGASGDGKGKGKDDERANGKLLSQSLQLFKDAPSVRVSYQMTEGSEVRVEVSSDRQNNCHVVAENEAFRFDVERGGRAWMRWSDAYLDMGSAGADGAQANKELRGKWLELSHDSKIRKNMAERCALTDMRKLADQMTGPHRGAYRDAEVTEQGERLIPLRQGDQGNSVTTYVQADGKPYPRKLVMDTPKVASVPVDVRFLAYGEPVAVEPPKDSQTVRSARIEALAEKNLALGLTGS
ncbi:hypothetical protein GCM10010324_61780 [Streptomyces hiroshimensis]|uniref:Lipoprotein n=1 Tax=Streptomyces hiroshimensis TaxID=66424 RepID=A0ABQ2Z8B7_9ACTN|nr:hypothetical protein GCM10010324_61780 [Streptomyces hiroshimensis]